jgi:hypothetical protein
MVKLAPAKAIDDRIIVADIINILKPWRPQLRQTDSGYLIQKTNTELRSEISQAVTNAITLLREASRDFFHRDAIRKVRDSARGIIKTIEDLERQLRAAPPELQLRLNLDICLDQLEPLKRVREACEVADNTQPSNDPIKAWCATTVAQLILKFSERRPTSSSPNSPFREITSLIYQAITVEPNADLKRACDDVLRGLKQAVQFTGKNSSDL